MWKPLPKTLTRLIISGILLFGNVSCRGTSEQSSRPKASPVVNETAIPRPVVKRTVLPAASPITQASPQTDQNYEQAIDIAIGAVSITKSAVSREDWSLAAKQWQQAIQLLKAIPASNRNHANAQKKLVQYQSFLTDAKERATPPPSKNTPGDINPQFFSIPIKGRTNGTPIVEIVFDGNQRFDMLFDTGASSTLITEAMARALRLKAVGLTPKGVADGAVVLLPFAFVKSIEVDGRLKRKLEVAIAPPAMPIGLLGQDFFEGYDIAIKENVIDFRRR